MALFDILRRRSIRELAALAAFIDEQATLLAERSVQDYSRLRAGEDAKALFAEAAFAAALEKARWEAYPLALAMVGELAEAVLRPHAGKNERAVANSLIALMLESFDRKPAPGPIGDAGRRAARQDLARSLPSMMTRPVKAAEAIADTYASLFLALMPIHERLSADDFPALRNDLTTMLGAIRDKLVERSDLPRLVAQLAAAGEQPAPQHD